jgi:transcriptional regulator with XRE-family HTH domain
MKELGNTLRLAREAKGFDINHVAKEIKMNPKYLKILESGDLSSVSKEIYILGYLKTYSSWLGLNSNEIINNFRASNKSFSISNNHPTESASAFASQENDLTPTRLVVFMCLILLVLFFFLMKDYKNNLYYNGRKNITDVEFRTNEYAGFSYKTGRHPKMVLIAKSDVSINLRYAEGFSTTLNLANGDTYFIRDDKDVLISSNKPKLIDVFAEQNELSYLGNLESFYVF